MRASSILARMALPLSAIMLTASTPAAAAEATPGPQRVAVSAADLLRVAENYARRGSPESAKAILALLSDDPDPNIRNEARYRRALLLEADGRMADAALLLRQVLDQQPRAAPVRLKLATMLQKMGDEQSALRQLRALRTVDLPPSVARFVDRLSASLQASKPFGVQFEVSLAPDSNINRATRSDTLGTVLGDFTFDKESKARSGTGAALRGMAHARTALSGDLALVGRISADANLYRHKAFDDVALDFAAGPEFKLGAIRLSGEAGAGQRWYGMKPYERTFRLGAGAVVPLGPVTQARLDAGARRTDNRLNDLQDGRGVSARLRLERALSPQLLVAASLGGERFVANDAAYSTKAWQAGLSAYRDIGRMTVNAGLDFGRLKADERLQLLPQARSDRLLRFTFGSVFRSLAVGGFAPVARIVVERNRSSVEFYDYKRTRTEFGISRAF